MNTSGANEMQDQLIIKEFCIEEITTANIKLMEKQILDIPEKPETKEQYENSKRFNIDVKKLLPRIEERRKQLKAPVIEKGKAIDDTAKRAVAMVQPLIELSGVRRDAWEAEKASEKAEKDLSEKLRIGRIQWHMDGLIVDCEIGLEYNTPSEIIFTALEILKDTEISEVDYQERTDEAMAKLSSAISATETALENRNKFEADQAEAARVKSEQEAEAKRLEEERAKLEADRKAQEEENRKASEAEAERRRQEEELIRAEREALEAEKERIQTVQNAFNVIPLTIKQKSDNPEDLNEYLHYLSALNVDVNVFQDRSDEFNEFIETQKQSIIELAHYHAIKDNEQWEIDLKAGIDIDHEAAIAENEQRKAEEQAAKKDFEACHAAALMEHDAYLRRKQLILKDKLKIQEQINLIDTAISDIKPCDFDTDEAAKVITDLYVSIKEALASAEKRGAELR